MKSNQIKVLVAFFALTIISGCTQNPYKDSLKAGQTIVTSNPANRNQTTRVFSIEAPELIECTEKSDCSAQIIGHVPSPGNPIVKISGLPAGATYDQATAFFSYTPGFDVVDVSKHPEASMILFPLTVTVSSSEDQVGSSSHSIILMVTNKMQPVEINVYGKADVDEGSKLEQTVEVKSADFPSGPFSLSALGAPNGTVISAVSGNPNLFKVSFTPDYTFAGVKDTRGSNSSHTKTVNVAYNVSLPIGKSVSNQIAWKINDVRQMPVVSGPEATTQGLDVNFSIRAEDLNGERAPKITMKQLQLGRLTTNTIAETSGQGLSLPSKSISVRWDQLLTSQLGTTTPILYEVCVQRDIGVFTLCVQKQVLVTLKVEAHPAPIIDRSFWKVGDLKFLRVGSAQSIKLPIADAENQGSSVKVSVTASQPSAVTWKNGILTINPLSEGVLQFSIAAESIYGQVTTENFVTEAMPTTWAKTVMFLSDAIQNDSVATAQLIPSLEFLSSKYQVSARTLALRESGVLTTESLALTKIDEALQNKFYNHVQFMLVSSPLAENLKGKMQEELKAFGVKVKGRLNTVLPGVDISALTLAVDPRSGLQSPNVPAGLKGLLTSESINPLILDVDQISANCVPLFNLQKRGFSGAVGVTCKRNDGKALTVLGFELADTLLDPKEAPLLTKWMSVFLTGMGK